MEPGVELGRVLADRAVVLSGLGELDAAVDTATEAAALAVGCHFDGYRELLDPILSSVVPEA